MRTSGGGGGGGVLVISDTPGRGGEGGVKKGQIFADVLYGWPLTDDKFCIKKTAKGVDLLLIS